MESQFRHYVVVLLLCLSASSFSEESSLEQRTSDSRSAIQQILVLKFDLPKSAKVVLSFDPTNPEMDSEKFLSLLGSLERVLHLVEHPKQLRNVDGFFITFRGDAATDSSNDAVSIDATSDPMSWIAAFSSKRSNETDYRKFLKSHHQQWLSVFKPQLGPLFPLINSIREMTCGPKSIEEFSPQNVRDGLNSNVIEVTKIGRLNANSVELGFKESTGNAKTAYGKGSLQIFRIPDEGSLGYVSIVVEYERVSKRHQRASARVRFTSDCVMGPSRVFHLTPDSRGIEREITLSGSGMVLGEIRRNPGVLPLEEIYRSGEEYFGKSASEMREMGRAKKEEVVALVDSGVDYNHPGVAFSFLRDSQEKLVGYDFYDQDALPFDFNLAFDLFSRTAHTHGTGVGGIVVGGDPRIGIIPLRVVGEGGNSEGGEPQDFYDAIKFGHEKGARIVNLSLGFDFYEEWESVKKEEAGELRGLLDRMDKHRELNRRAMKAVEKAIQEFSDTLFVIAAGNGDPGTHLGRDISKGKHWLNTFSAPNVLAVASVTKTGALSTFSDFGKPVHLAAWGEDVPVYTHTNRIDPSSGTSFASPAVAHAAAKVRLANPSLAPGQIVKILTGTTVKMPGLKDKVSSGGILNLDKAIEKATQLRKVK